MSESEVRLRTATVRDRVVTVHFLGLCESRWLHSPHLDKIEIHITYLSKYDKMIDIHNRLLKIQSGRYQVIPMP